MADKRPAKNQRKMKVFTQKYGGLTRKEWAKYKKQNPQKAHELRMKNQ